MSLGRWKTCWFRPLTPRNVESQPMTTPKTWTGDELDLAARSALAHFVTKRLAEGSIPYQEAFRQAKPRVQALFRATNNLRHLDDAVLVNAPELLEAARYLGGPLRGQGLAAHPIPGRAGPRAVHQRDYPRRCQGGLCGASTRRTPSRNRMQGLEQRTQQRQTTESRDCGQGGTLAQPVRTTDPYNGGSLGSVQGLEPDGRTERRRVHRLATRSAAPPRFCCRGAETIAPTAGTWRRRSGRTSCSGTGRRGRAEG